MFLYMKVPAPERTARAGIMKEDMLQEEACRPWLPDTHVFDFLANFFDDQPIFS